MTTIDLHGTLERIRSEKYPELKPELVTEILKIQSDYLEDPTEAYRRISQLLENHLESAGDLNVC